MLPCPWPQVEHTPTVHKRILDVLPGVSGGVARVMVSHAMQQAAPLCQDALLAARCHAWLRTLGAR